MTDQSEDMSAEQPQRSGRSLRVSAAQLTPAFLDRGATMTIAAGALADAAADGVDLVVFPESFAPGYPDWIWRRPPMSDGDWYRRFVDEAVDVDAGDLAAVQEAARDNQIWVAMGVTERLGSDSLCNSVIYVDDGGSIAGRHRKLIPTGAERMVWANGYENLLTTLDIRGVLVGSLICWENYMPLARTAMYQQGIEVLLSPTWDNSDEWVPTLRHIAKEGQIYVVGVTACLRGSDIPRDLSDAADLYGGDEDWLSKGNSTIVGPGGGVMEGPLVGEAGTVTADLDMDAIASGRRMFDPVGHYARPDVLELLVKVAADR